jgi:oligopeptide transport system ATP-binding protein
MTEVLKVKNLKTIFKTRARQIPVLNNISFSIASGETVGIVGESGSGKTVTMLSIMRLLSENGRVVEGEIIFNGRDLLSLKEREMQHIRGNEISMIFQDPYASLNPLLTVGNQITEAIKRHSRISSSEARKKAVGMLKMVGVPDPEKRIKQYPHEFSGGMRQRVMIAIALCCQPKLLIADEPTTALDVTIQAQMLGLMKELKHKKNTSIILITHDLGLVAGICDRVIVMYGGTIVEQGSVDDIFYQPRHPYTKGLLKCIPRLNVDKGHLTPIEGQPSDMTVPPTGCAFVDRCIHAMKICDIIMPKHTEVRSRHECACWLLNIPQRNTGGIDSE